MKNQEKQSIREIQLKIKKYLELDNVSFLVGAGGSFHLGAPIIRKISGCHGLDVRAETEKYFGKGKDPSYEDLFNCLQADIFLTEQKEQKKESSQVQRESMTKMQRWLFENCDTEKTTIPGDYSSDEKGEKLKENRYYYHELLIKKLLQRPGNLRRANLFTLNYDMAFDYALDNLGVHYINGFSGVHNRCFRPEVYDYDIFYPGQSVSGKVHRAEKVLRYYKLHGSLSWQSVEPSIKNTYGIREVQGMGRFDENHQLMVYPCVNKKTYTLDLPYSELFRQFAQAITQPQSVLVCLGYSFNDEHVNDIIKQALSIPSFTLIIANYVPPPSSSSEEKSAAPDSAKKETVNNGASSSEEDRTTSNKRLSEIELLKMIGDKRIIILDETDLAQSSFVGFVENIMPDLYEVDEQIALAKTLETLFSDNNPQMKSEATNDAE